MLLKTFVLLLVSVVIAFKWSQIGLGAVIQKSPLIESAGIVKYYKIKKNV